MSYDFFSEEELRHEVELTEKQTKRLKEQLDRLLSLRSEGKVSDAIFKEVLDEIANRYNAFVPKVNELRRAVEAKLDEMREEDRELRHNLESLEVRFTIGSIPEDQYKVNRASYTMRLQNMEDFSGSVTTAFTSINDNANRLSSALVQTKQTTPRELSAESGAVPTLPQTEPSGRVAPASLPSVQPVQTRPPSSKGPTAPPPKGPQQPKAKTCSRCGAENPGTSIYCYNCGAKIP